VKLVEKGSAFLPKTVYPVQFADHLTGVLGMKWVKKALKFGSNGKYYNTNFL